MNTFQPIAPVASKPFIPPFRLEIRDAGNELAPWSLFDTAQTQHQAKDKITRHRVKADCETRIVPNGPIEAPASVRVQDTPETKLFLERLGTENLALRRENSDLEIKLEKLEAQKNPPPAPLDLGEGPAPLPFDVGALLRDIHTGVAVRVTALNPTGPDGQPRPGFAWESTVTQPGDKDHLGFCPLNSVSCYEVVGAKKSRGKKHVHTETAAGSSGTVSNSPTSTAGSAAEVSGTSPAPAVPAAASDAATAAAADKAPDAPAPAAPAPAVPAHAPAARAHHAKAAAKKAAKGTAHAAAKKPGKHKHAR